MLFDCPFIRMWGKCRVCPILSAYHAPFRSLLFQVVKCIGSVFMGGSNGCDCLVARTSENQLTGSGLPCRVIITQQFHVELFSLENTSWLTACSWQDVWLFSSCDFSHHPVPVAVHPDTVSIIHQFFTTSPCSCFQPTSRIPLTCRNGQLTHFSLLSLGHWGGRNCQVSPCPKTGFSPAMHGSAPGTLRR